MMLKSVDPTQTEAWKKLSGHATKMKSIQLRHLFTADTERFSKFSVALGPDSCPDLFLDYSKNLLNEETVKLLLALADECQLPAAIKQLFSGAKINRTENRAVLHTALRHQGATPVLSDNEDVMPGVRKVLEQMRRFSDKVINGEWLGYSGKPVRNIVNIGIGGSDLGPHMVTEALKIYQISHLTVHYVSNIDSAHIHETLKLLDPETTLFLIASKSFTTQETMTNAESARSWFLAKAQSSKHIAKHFAAISVNSEKVREFGISENNRFEFWDWVGGRFSLCSAIGLSIACSVGFENFEKLLHGAYEMDMHFAQVPHRKNIPVLLALIGIWYGGFFDADSEAILPYDQYLNRFVPYIQQCNMESNGKSIDRNGQKINYQTGPVVFGEPGTNGQHAFYQLLHQGTKFIPCDFLAPANRENDPNCQHPKLLAHFFAQTEALAFGNVAEQLAQQEPFKLFRGNHPSNSILYKSLTPYTLGSLIAMYEHKIFVQGVIWNIFSFDQWGVELGKKLAAKILPELENSEPVTSHDSSTNGLINLYKSMRV